MNWGHKITISFVVFFCIMVTMVVISMRQDVGLVSADYYKQEIAYQDQIDRIKRTKGLKEAPEIGINREFGFLEIRLPQDKIAEGEVWLFRPSDDEKDRKYAMPETGLIQIPIDDFIAGRWQVKVQWTHATLEYYIEEDIFI